MKKGLALILALLLALSCLPMLSVAEEAEEPVAVDDAAVDNAVKYYALCIGEVAFNPTCYRNIQDAKNMASMLRKVKGAKGGKFKVTVKQDLDYYDVKNAIKSTFKKAKKNDVCLFFIATHGASGSGALSTVGYYNYSIWFSELAQWLKDSCKGKVIVILQSCYAGASIYKYGVKENEETGVELGSELSAPAKGAAANGSLIDNSADFVSNDEAAIASAQNAVKAFAAADPGFDELQSNTGELRTSKFYVLAASRSVEMSWGYEYDYSYRTKSHNLFPSWLLEGVGTKSKSPADKNKDKYITLKELYNYVRKYDSYTIRDKYGYTYHQHVQAWPKSSSYKLFSWR